ncbi:MAG TPA: ABC transporter ATP-binding protein [Thermoplasmata archaeon]|nr:ABC transporter ATP-binding protein [Thermoplasmata archaeon]
MSNLSIETNQLTKVFGSFTAVNSLTLKVEGTKCVGFLGPNGAGKTTTLKILTAMVHPTSGTARINGVDVQAEKRHALHPCGVLIESPEIYPALTPREALSYVAELRGIPAPERTGRIKAVLDQVRMADWIDKRTGKFSKGMKQRVNLAAALLSDPDILILDEPTTGLDPRGMAEVRDIVLDLKKQQKLIFMSSHLLGEVADICDEVAMIDQGKLLIYDTIERVVERVSGMGAAVEVDFASSDLTGIEEKIRAMPGVDHVEHVDSRTFLIRFSGGLPAQERLLSELVAARIGVVSFKPSSGMARLEDAYLNLVKGGY